MTALEQLRTQCFRARRAADDMGITAALVNFTANTNDEFTNAWMQFKIAGEYREVARYHMMIHWFHSPEARNDPVFFDTTIYDFAPDTIGAFDALELDEPLL